MTSASRIRAGTAVFLAAIVLIAADAAFFATAGGDPPLSPPSASAGATLPPGAALPDDATCAGRVVRSEEIRPTNSRPNQTPGGGKGLSGPFMDRLSGDFVGTTDEILQWVSCKWGIDADIIRAQAAQESSWFMSAAGDFTTETQWCAPGHPPGADGRPGCAQSVGMMGVKFRYHGDAFPEAGQSTAYNLDYTVATWRACFEGSETWLASNPPDSGYRAGDIWGCLGRWFAGDWRSGEALGYIGRVQAAYRNRVWETPWFAALTTPASAG